MHEPIPHGHITHKLRRSLIGVVLLGIVAAGFLAGTIALVNYNIEQTALRSKQTAIDNISILLEAQQKFALPENTSYSPGPLDKDTIVSVVAKNQPAVVRIVTMYCADIMLGNVSDFSDTCSGRVGSGSLISSDGYIATSGHGTTMNARKAFIESLTTTEKVDKYLNYLTSARLISNAQKRLIKEGMATGDADGQATFEATIDLIADDKLVATDESIYYAVQLSNQPVTLHELDGRLIPVYDDTVVEATLIDKDFDQAASDIGLETGTFATSDVALLKVEGVYPYIPLGSVDTVRVGDQLTAIGFPSSISGIDSTLIQSIPSISQGTVTEITTDAEVNGRKLIATTIPIAQGNSGGPVFNTSGEQIGLATYSLLECPELDCYGDGKVRDIADIQALVARNGITLQTDGITDDWEAGLTAYTRGDYDQALKLFTKVKNEYPANYLVNSFLSVAQAEVGSAADASRSYQARSTIVNILIVLGIMAFFSIVILEILIIHFTRKHRLGR